MSILEAMENFVFPDNLQGMFIFCQMPISLNIQLCNFQTEMADKVLKQSTWNQLQDQPQELSFQERYHTFCETFYWTAYFDKPKGVKLGFCKVTRIIE